MALGVLTAVALLAWTPGAGAAVTIGQTRDATGGNCDAGFDWVAVAVPSGGSYVVPGTGTITSWTMDASGVTGQQFKMKIFRKVGQPRIYQVVGHGGPETLTLPGRNTFPANVRVQPGDVLGFHTLTDASECNLENVNGATIDFVERDLADGTADAFDFDDGNYLLNIEAAFEPDNTFAIGALARNKKKGTAIETVTVPNPGTLTVSGNGVKQASTSGARTAVSVPAAGPVQVTIRAKGKKRRKLNQTGKVKVQAKLTYTPTGGTAHAENVKVKLKKKG